MIDLMPEEAKPHEASILLVYSMGITNADDIRKFLHYETANPVYKVLRKYRDILPKYRGILSLKTQHIRLSQ